MNKEVFNHVERVPRSKERTQDWLLCVGLFAALCLRTEDLFFHFLYINLQVCMGSQRAFSLQCNKCWNEIQNGEGYSTMCNHVFCVRFHQAKSLE